MTHHPTRTIFWQRLHAPGTEYCMLQPSARGWLLQGDATTVLGDQPARLLYQIRLDADWHTHRVAADLLIGAAHKRIHLVRHARRGWRTRPENHPLPDLRDCTDVDLSLSPSTNTLPIRRLKLSAGQSAEVTAAWLRFPEAPGDEVIIQPLYQRYTRLDAQHYLYESGPAPGEHTFSAMLAVDDAGLITYYEGLWERIATADAPASDSPPHDDLEET